MKDIKLEDRLIFALDVPEISDAMDIVLELDDSVNFYKIGMEMLMTGQYFELLEWLIKKEKKVFVDLKFFDVPETVGRTIARLSDYGATFATIHGNQALMEKASQNKNNLKILAVTALTSLDRGDLDDLGFSCDIKELVISRAKRAFEAGCDGHDPVKCTSARGTFRRLQCSNSIKSTWKTKMYDADRTLGKEKNKKRL